MCEKIPAEIPPSCPAINPASVLLGAVENRQPDVSPERLVEKELIMKIHHIKGLQL